MAFEYLRGYVTFSSVTEMDEHVAKQLAKHEAILTEAERAIVYKIASHALAYPGVAHLKAETIAKSLKLSTKTVYRAVKKLSELGMIEKVATTKLNGIKGANIYRILPIVSLEMSERVARAEASNQADEMATSENQSSFSFNLSKTSSIYTIYKELQSEMAHRTVYMNEFQQTLYHLLIILPLKDELKDGLHRAILASSVNNRHEFILARDALMGIIRDVESGMLTITTTLRAVFKGAYEKRCFRPICPPKRIQPQTRPQVVFYDWLTEREQ
ncbi:helix-turn-helix domain-containing protein [Lysinibacillus sp. KU-BSD001]|uniref:helix-turn-helix domain-containing protein n=1 Tax=Lysinibacillus sp. KU-BSD001 TaxID=3141328 RepID=UPI0036E45E5A